MNYISINFFLNDEGFVTTENYVDEKEMFRMAVSVGRGTDGYTGFGRHCLRGKV